MSGNLQLRTKAWLSRARSDLRLARIAAAAAEPPLDSAIYHCQQAAEKAVKAFLHDHEATVQRTHDIARLAREASTFDPRFGNFAADAQLLTPLITAYRYPDEAEWEPLPEPTRVEFDSALTAAQRIYDFVLSLLPIETHPT